MKPFRVLNIGFGNAGQPITKGNIKMLNNLDRESEIHVISGSSQPTNEVEAKLDTWNTGHKVFYSATRRGNIERFFEENNEFDLITISAGGGKSDPDLEQVLRGAMMEAGFDISDKSVDYRLIQEVPKNWGLIKEYASLIKKYDVKGVVDIFTNQPDLLTYLFASMTGRVKDVVGNNHLDTRRLQTGWRTHYRKYLQENHGSIQDLKLAPIDAICTGYHGGGCVPIITNSTVGNNSIDAFMGGLSKEGIYTEIQKGVIEYAKKALGNNIGIRDEITECYKDLIEAMDNERKILGMSVFQKITENPCFDVNDFPKLKDLDDIGIFFGYGSRFVETPEGHEWELVHPKGALMNVYEQESFIDSYVRFHKLIKTLHQEGYIPNLVVAPEENTTSSKKRKNLESITVSHREPVTNEGKIFIPGHKSVHIIEPESVAYKRGKKVEYQFGTHKQNSRLVVQSVLPTDDYIFVDAHKISYQKNNAEISHLVKHHNDGRVISRHKFQFEDQPVTIANIFDLHDTMAEVGDFVYGVLFEQDELNVRYVFFDTENPDKYKIITDLDQAIISVANSERKLVLGGQDFIYTGLEGNVKKLTQPETDPSRLRSIEGEGAIMYSNMGGNNVYLVDKSTPRTHYKINHDGVFDVNKNGELIIASVNGKVLTVDRYNSIGALADNNSFDHREKHTHNESFGNVHVTDDHVIATSFGNQTYHLHVYDHALKSVGNREMPTISAFGMRGK